MVAGIPEESGAPEQRPGATFFGSPHGGSSGEPERTHRQRNLQNVLAIDLEGTEACDWLTSKGITCVLLRYRVPSAPYDWRCDCRPHNLALSVPALQDAQRTVRLVRFHANEWHIAPHCREPRRLG